MTKQITLEEALELVSFDYTSAWGWRVRSVFDSIYGDVHGDIYSHIYGDVHGDVHKEIAGDVWGTINGHKWKFVETPKDKLQRLIEESGNQELLDTFNQLEDNQ